MITTIFKRVSFDSAHCLKWHSGKCKNFHGHTYFLEVGITGEINSDGVVMDFGDVKKHLKSLVEKLDHKNLNEIYPNPTAEIMANDIFLQLKKVMPVTIIRLWETPTSFVEVKDEK